MRNPRRDMYGRRPNSMVWHFRRECRQYPPVDGSIFKRQRPTGKLCAKCQAIEHKEQVPSSSGWQPD